MPRPKPHTLSLVEAAESALSRARLNADDLRHRRMGGDTSVTDADLALAGATIEGAELDLAGAHRRETEAAEAERQQAWAALLDEIAGGGTSDLAHQIGADTLALVEAAAQLASRCDTYASVVGKLLSQAAQLGDPPDEVTVEFGHVGRVTRLTTGTATLSHPGRRFGAQLLELAATAATTGNPAALERTWRQFAAAHPGHDWPATPEHDRAQAERLATRQREREWAKREQRAHSERDIVRQAHGMAAAGDLDGVHKLVTSPAWPADEPPPAGYAPVGDDAVAVVAADPGGVEARPRRRRPPALSDDPPPAA